MKIRLFSDSVRVRLTQVEVEALAAGGAIESVTPFPGEALACTVQPSANLFEAHHAAGRVSILVPMARTAEWAASDEEGMYTEQVDGSGRALRISVEKDYRCIHKPDAPDNAGTYPNPLATGE